MTNEHDSENPAAEPQSQLPQQSPVAPPAPPQGEIGPDSNERPNNEQDTARELAREFRWVEFAQLVVNGVLAIVGIIALCIYNGQLGVMRGQLGEIIRQYPELQKSAGAAQDAAEVSKEALHSAQRAFVTFPPAPHVALFNLPSGGIFELEMPIENAGATQAHALKDRVSCITPMGPLPNGYTFPDIKSDKCGTPWAATGANVIPAKGTMASQKVFVEEKIFQEFVQQNSGPWPNRVGAPSHATRGVYFYGWATYRDIFKDSPEHLTEFCRDLTLMIIQPQGIQNEWGYCPVHNCTDEDCPDYKERIKEADAAPTCCASTISKKSK